MLVELDSDESERVLNVGRRRGRDRGRLHVEGRGGSQAMVVVVTRSILRRGGDFDVVVR